MLIDTEYCSSGVEALNKSCARMPLSKLLRPADLPHHLILIVLLRHLHARRHFVSERTINCFALYTVVQYMDVCCTRCPCHMQHAPCLGG